MKKIIFLGLIALTATACSDNFLKEDMVSTITQDYFNTEQGLDQLIVGTYNSERVKWGYREGPYMFETGHDCCVKSGDNDLSEYSNSIWAADGMIGTVANEFMGFQSKPSSGFLINYYPIIDNCNKAITAIRSGSAEGKYATDADYAAQRLSEVLFNRAYAYYNLNTIFGDVYYTGTSKTTLPNNYVYARTTSEELYKILISDLRYAVNHLPELYTKDEFGRITKYAAAHLLSKLYLHRAQGADYGTTAYGRNTDGSIDNTNNQSYLGMLYKGSISTDLDSCIYYSSMVINNVSLADNYSDIFDHPVSDFSCEGISEDILSAVFSESGDDYRYGVRVLCMFVGNYVNAKYGIPDWCWEYGTKPNFYFHNSDFGLDVFTDKLYDSRYQKSFRLEYKTALNTSGPSTPGANGDYYSYNNASNATYQWTENQAEYFNNNILPNYTNSAWDSRKAVAGEHKMGTGDLAFAFLENTKKTAIPVEEADAQPFVLYARWMKDGSKYYYRPQIVASTNTYTFANAANYYALESSSNTGVPCCSKYDDPNRSGKNSIYGGRDVPIMRVAEAYLIRAEAYGRKNDYTDAIADINVLRKRAAYKSGETRDEVLARLYPGSEKLDNAEKKYPYTVDEDCYSKIKVDATYWNGTSDKSTAENYAPAANSDSKRFIEFIANEYAREFNEEEIYYEEVHHAGIQAERIQWHNQMGANSSNTDYTAGSWDSSDNTSGTNGQTGEAKGGFQNYMTFKPLPQSFIDMLTDEKGKLLDDAAKETYQNHGY
ncbi:MAG: RagB/SusD family nutrient uptake outer membrane protein [Bacteroidaceae bacterium]|nr:RagB/SusD family nutrient uptake outer membrane protein [Bacteroidaceae bacterium]